MPTLRLTPVAIQKTNPKDKRVELWDEIERGLHVRISPDGSKTWYVRYRTSDGRRRRWKLGRFTFPKQLPKGQSYGLIVIARGYRDMAIDSALRISANAPEHGQIYPVPMIKD